MLIKEVESVPLNISILYLSVPQHDKTSIQLVKNRKSQTEIKSNVKTSWSNSSIKAQNPLFVVDCCKYLPYSRTKLMFTSLDLSFDHINRIVAQNCTNSCSCSREQIDKDKFCLRISLMILRIEKVVQKQLYFLKS